MKRISNEYLALSLIVSDISSTTVTTGSVIVLDFVDDLIMQRN